MQQQQVNPPAIVWASCRWILLFVSILVSVVMALSISEDLRILILHQKDTGQGQMQGQNGGQGQGQVQGQVEGVGQAGIYSGSPRNPVLLAGLNPGSPPGSDVRDTVNSDPVPVWNTNADVPQVPEVPSQAQSPEIDKTSNSMSYFISSENMKGNMTYMKLKPPTPTGHNQPAIPEYLTNPNVITDNLDLVTHIKKVIDPPAANPAPATSRTDYSEKGQSGFVDQILKRRTNGFFLECGAAGGLQLSNTYFFEKMRGWRGLLVEADPDEYQALLEARRNAYSINACLSPQNRTETLQFTARGTLGQLEGPWPHHPAGEGAVSMPVQCFPLHSLLLALGVTHIDYFSLDVEGVELEILKTVPFGAVTIDVFTIEFLSFNKEFPTMKKLEALKEFFEQQGNYEIGGILPDMENAQDVVFVRKGVK